ncbi:MAG: DUF393 domain-containing protein [Anaerolineae bacterium]|nr:DUF393 domain-containing protein [Thermoflexales bacterium]MDW8406483.1 DUF393 domain-containing protein [Anaerolineae bacterium]
MLRWDRHARIEVLPYQTPGLLERTGLTAAQCAEAAWFVYPDGRQYRAAAAINRALHELGGMWRLLALFYRMPGIRHLEDAAYRWVARNRHRLPGASAACAASSPSTLHRSPEVNHSSNGQA